MLFENIGLKVPSILLPKKSLDYSQWAVVACDQFTSEPEYWQNAANLVKGAPSTLNLIYPEVFLEEPEGEKTARIQKINQTMREYLNQGIFETCDHSFILVDRRTSHVSSRKGLVVALDLEAYDYSRQSQTLIRATEGTILDRIPPRVRIREKAPLETPHIMVLIDDPQKTVIEPLFQHSLEKVYDVALMQGGGHITGYRVSDPEWQQQVAERLSKLAQRDLFDQKYGVADKGVLLYAMGDGNHSLATAKALWENLKKNAVDKSAVMSHPARFALVELVNVHDAGLVFEPIHRVLFDVDYDHIVSAMSSYFAKQGASFSCDVFDQLPVAKEHCASLHQAPHTHAVLFVAQQRFGVFAITNPVLTLAVGTLQSFLDDYLKANSYAKIDYIHGEDVVTSLGSKSGNMGFYLSAMSKHDLFRTVIVDGALPRKTFSMGEASEKRYYLECRSISDRV